jgi:4-diphosphocytidyl-2-C-methyl-D-erythritol kinase
MFLSEVISPIKLNLNLHIIGVNNMGYHLLQGVSFFADYGDIIQVSVNNTKEDDLSIHGRYSSFLTHDDTHNNLIIKAINALRAYKDFPYVTVILEKKIPLQAGYGGGSSNAATILKCLNHVFNLGLSYTDLFDIGRTLGADVPMCLYGKPCFVQNIGDYITPLEYQNKTYACLLFKPDSIMASTEHIFKQLIKKNNPAMPITNTLIDDAIKYGRNDLWQSIILLYPKLQDYLNALNFTNPIKATMSGSGSGLFSLYDNDDAMNKAYEQIKNQFPTDFLEKTHIRV